MLLTEEEYNKPINFKNKIVDNTALGMKLHSAMRKTLGYILNNPNKIHTIKNGIEKVSLTNEMKEGDNYYCITELGTHRYYNRPKFILEYRAIKFRSTYWTNNFQRGVVDSITFNQNFDIERWIEKGNNSKSTDDYLKYFIKMTSLQSKNFKKRLIKAIYIFENETNVNKKYKKMFNFICNRFNFYIENYVNNYDSRNKKLIDPNKIYSWHDRYSLKGYSKIPTKQESRNISITNILKNKK